MSNEFLRDLLTLLVLEMDKCCDLEYDVTSLQWFGISKIGSLNP